MAAPSFMQATVKSGPKLAWTAHWLYLRRLDEKGDWDLQALARSTARDDQGARRLLARLLRAGLVAAVNPSQIYSLRRYRLVNPPEEAPLMDGRGVLVAEPLVETVWRAVKMAKSFTAEEIATEIDRLRQFAMIRRYLLTLVEARVLSVSGRRGQEVFRLRQAAGAHAPRPVRATGMFDPNTGTFIGALVADEVTP
jgi:hypothetical protein